jgi:aspartyl-tRNA synthetase
VTRLLDVVHQVVTGRRPPRFAPVWVDRPPFWRPEAPVDGAYHRSRSLFGEILTGEYEDGPVVQSYDLLLNGVELLSGGQKEPSREQLLANLRLAGVCEPEGRYAYYLEALDQGAPPLHNTSIGWDRALAMLLGTTMRDVMVLPKDGDGSCPVSGVPVPV